MEAPFKTLLDLKLTVDLEIEWDCFKGRTKEQFIRMIEDDILEAIEEARPEIQKIHRIQIED
jgi:hypothetical protein